MQKANQSSSQQQAQENNPIDDTDSELELLDREIKILDDGSAIIKDKTLTTTTLTPRDFISWMRKYEESRDNIKLALSDKQKKLVEENLKKVEEDIEKLKPYVEESEKKTQAHYEKLKKEGLISKVTEELNKPMSEINLAYMSSVWHNLLENEQEIVGALTAEQKQKFLKIKIKLMQQNRGKKH